jgi:hypothetical protein
MKLAAELAHKRALSERARQAGVLPAVQRLAGRGSAHPHRYGGRMSTPPAHAGSSSGDGDAVTPAALDEARKGLRNFFEDFMQSHNSDLPLPPLSREALERHLIPQQIVTLAESGKLVPSTLAGADHFTYVETEEVEQCCVCLDPMDDVHGEPVTAKQGCGHTFHRKCIFNSMKQKVDSAGLCPLCRGDLNSVDGSSAGIIAEAHVYYNQREDEDEQDPGLRTPLPPPTAVQPEPESNLGDAAESSSSDNTARPGFNAEADNGGGDDDSPGSDDGGSAGSDDNGDENGPIPHVDGTYTRGLPSPRPKATVARAGTPPSGGPATTKSRRSRL